MNIIHPKFIIIFSLTSINNVYILLVLYLFSGLAILINSSAVPICCSPTVNPLRVDFEAEVLFFCSLCSLFIVVDSNRITLAHKDNINNCPNDGEDDNTGNDKPARNRYPGVKCFQQQQFWENLDKYCHHGGFFFYYLVCFKNIYHLIKD